MIIYNQLWMTSWWEYWILSLSELWFQESTSKKKKQDEEEPSETDESDISSEIDETSDSNGIGILHSH